MIYHVVKHAMAGWWKWLDLDDLDQGWLLELNPTLTLKTDL